MTSPSPTPLTEAEQIAARILGIASDAGPEYVEKTARKLVAAVRPAIAKELVESAEIIREFAQSRPVTSAEARAIFDGIATSLSLPASKETPDGD